MSLRPFRLATILEAIKVAELRYLEARVGGMNNATTYQSADEVRPHWRYKGPLRPWNTLTLGRPAEAEPECVG
jgi:hypothetical protein